MQSRSDWACHNGLTYTVHRSSESRPNTTSTRPNPDSQGRVCAIPPIGARRPQLLTMYTAIGAASSVHCVVDGVEYGGPWPRSGGMLVPQTILWRAVHITSLRCQRFVQLLMHAWNTDPGLRCSPRPLMLQTTERCTYCNRTADLRSLCYAARITIH